MVQGAPSFDDHQALHAAIDGFLSTLTSANTRSAYRTDMAAFAAWHAAYHSDQQPGRAMRIELSSVELFRQHCRSSGVGEATVARRVSAVKGFLRHTSQLEPASPAPVASPTQGLDADERHAVLTALADHDMRTRLLVAMLLLDGLKLDEVLQLDTDHISGRPPATVTIVRHRQHHQHRLDTYTADVVRRHLRTRRHGPLLTSERGGTAEARLTRFGADYLLKKVGRSARLSAPLTANVLRRTHAETAHRDGESEDEIRHRMGHDDVRTTRRYLPPSPQP
ncbi:MAG: site-specific integrase [Actinobacteria bacterium]|nr:site-specific integrase [Actinomycetota bacterium]